MEPKEKSRQNKLAKKKLKETTTTSTAAATAKTKIQADNIIIFGLLLLLGS